MEASKQNQLTLVESNPSTSFQGLLDLQKELLHNQIDILQNIVVTQCKLTGVNPLSQEMAAGALSIKIGKRPRDLLNPKAIKYMQSVFSIKDAISKKESKAISALFGVTATQVREFFTGQRSRVRRFVRLSREKAIRSDGCIEVQDGTSCSDSNIPIHPDPLNCVGPTSTEGPSCCTQDEVLPGIDDSDKYFLANIFIFLRKEESFSGQVKLLEWILQIRNSAVLCWFLTKGGVMILATWLSQAAIEEQTSVLHVILKVLCHLPLHKAIPAHMSAILQSVNRLRFYRTSDISNRAKILLSRWSKMFARSQAMRKPNSMISPSDAQDEMLLNQSIGEIMGNESWESKVIISDEPLTPSYENLENSRNLGSLQPMRLLMASTDDSNKRLLRGVFSSQTRERRKVQMVEQPGQKVAGRSSLVARSVPVTQGRPLSADDIQKAKMRAQFMQSKYGKNVASSCDESPQVKIDGPKTCSSSQVSIMLSTSKAYVRPKVEEHKKPTKIISRVSNQQETALHNNTSVDWEEPLWKKCKKFQNPWLTPPEMYISKAWSVGSGENSKEVEIQKNRIRREKGITYKTVQDIPSNPKEPWDREMDYDDTLTPEIQMEQMPDGDGMETQVLARENQETEVLARGSTSGTCENSNSNMPEPDLELLAVLLKNPELVFALTSGEGGNLSSDQMVKLLDMIKANGVSSVGSLINGVVDEKAEEKIEVSLPSPTPSSNPVTGGWRPEIAKNPFSRQNVTVNGEAYGSRLVQQPRIPVDSMVVPQQSVTAPPLTQQAFLPSIRQRILAGSPNIQARASELVPNRKDIPVSSRPLPTFLNSASPSRDDTVATFKPSQVSVILNTPSAAFFVPPSFQTPAEFRAQPQPPEPRLSAHSWRARHGLANHNNYNAYGGGMVHPGLSWERNELHRGEPGFETWSPDHSPFRSSEYVGGWSRLEPGMNSGHNCGPETSRPRNPSGYRDRGNNGNGNGNQRWHHRRR